jgi:hypothetical protein
VTHTRTHVYITFANPYLTCDQCGQPVTGWHDPERCGCDESGWRNRPCDHRAGVTSVCPSWGPVDGCQCQEHLGHLPHGLIEQEDPS